MQTTPEELRRLAREHLQKWPGVETYTRQHGRIQRPIAVEHPRATLTFWFVAVGVGDRIAGYFLFDQDGRLTRYSSFLRDEGGVAALPDLGSWTDARRVAEAAARHAEGRRLGEPYLTFDGVPARLAWAVPLRTDDDGVVFVAGDVVYSRPHEPGSTG